MRKREWVVLVVVVALQVCTLFGVVVSIHHKPDWTSLPGWKDPFWSGWAQAFGAVAAVLIAVYVMDRSHQRGLENERRQTADKIRRHARLLMGIAAAGSEFLDSHSFTVVRPKLNATRLAEEALDLIEAFMRIRIEEALSFGHMSVIAHAARDLRDLRARMQGGSRALVSHELTEIRRLCDEIEKASRWLETNAIDVQRGKDASEAALP